MKTSGSLTEYDKKVREDAARPRLERGEGGTSRTLSETRCWVAVTAFVSRFMLNLRSEHTVINLIAPPDDEDALSPAQMVQLFWNTICIELFVCAFQFSAVDEAVTARSRYGGGAVQADDGNQVSLGTFTVAPVTAFTQGVIAAGITISAVLIGAHAFRLGNSRQRSGNKTLVKSLRRRLLRLCGCRKAGSRDSTADNDEEEEEEPEPPPPAAPPSLLDPETSAKIGAGLTGALGGAVIGDAALTAANVGLTGELITDAALIGAAVLGGGAIYAANRPDEAGEAARFVGGSVANVTSAYVELAQVNAELALLEKQREARAAIDGAVGRVQATPGRVASDAKKGLKSTVRGVRDAPGKLWSNVKGTFGGAAQEEEE